MGARSGELRGSNGATGRVGFPRRSLLLLVAVIAVGLGVGFAIGSLVKGGESGSRSPAKAAANPTTDPGEHPGGHKSLADGGHGVSSRRRTATSLDESGAKPDLAVP
jgi:hypothetical protein